MSKTLTSNLGHGMRLLRDDELDAVIGGVTGDCIRLGSWPALPTVCMWLDPYGPEPLGALAGSPIS